MEKWTRWNPNKDLIGKYHIEKIIWPTEGLKVYLANNNQQVQLWVEGFMASMRHTKESPCFTIREDLDKSYGKDFYKDWSFFKIENSKYLQWMSEYSDGISDFEEVMHYCIFDGNQTVDIFLHYEPTITVKSI